MLAGPLLDLGDQDIAHHDLRHPAFEFRDVVPHPEAIISIMRFACGLLIAAASSRASSARTSHCTPSSDRT
jgi:hypothetical protein